MKRTEEMPDLVYWGLWGVNSKAVAYSYLYLCLFISLGAFIYGFKDPIYFIGTGFVLSAVWYYYSIRWVDKNATWDIKNK